MKPERSIANFDSAAAMLRATAAYLRGEDFPALGVIPRPLTAPMRGVGRMVNRLPRSLREQVYIWSGWNEAVPDKKLSEVSIEEISEWAAGEYPQKRYPGAMIGSSNGAMTHLCAAMGIPWLPQTFLVPVRRSGPHPDIPSEDMEWSVQPARDLLKANPDIALHHMHDPNQDRLMVQRMCYFRVKKQRLGKAYERFLLNHVEPGGTLYIVNCSLRWPTITVQDRHHFQFGALGGAEIEEFMEGSDRVRDYLRRYESEVETWDAPAADKERPEAEWGFDAALGLDIERFAELHDFQVKTITFELPEEMSPVVADFYREFNERRGIIGNRLLVESFVLLEPYWAMRTGSVPYWMFFNKEPSLKAITEFLAKRAPFDDIYMTLFSHGVDSVGLASIEQWKEILAKARRKGEFVGVDEQAYPRDFAVLPLFQHQLIKQVPARYPLPPPVAPATVESFIHGLPRSSRVKIAEGFPGSKADLISERRPSGRPGRLGRLLSRKGH
jgi:hypothetical protein